jgi:thiol-disulfide isomerase/thioredoxin
MTAQMRNSLLATGLVLVALIGVGGCDPADPSEASTGLGDIAVLPAGEKVDLTGQAVAGKITVYDFYADWCAPCRILSPALEDLANEHPEELALRKVDVVGWESEAAVGQEIEFLPYLAVVDADGQVVAEGDRAFTYLRKRFGVDLMSVLRIL